MRSDVICNPHTYNSETGTIRAFKFGIGIASVTHLISVVVLR